jgi:multidrug efflux pump
MLQTAPGADVRVFGERKYAMRIWLDADKLAAYRLTTQDVEDALRRQPGSARRPHRKQQREFNVTAATDLQTPGAVQATSSSRTVNGTPVRLRDVARVQQGPLASAVYRAPERPRCHHAGRDPQGHGQPAGPERGVRALMPQASSDLPPGIVVEVANDNSVFIDRSIKACTRPFSKPWCWWRW